MVYIEGAISGQHQRNSLDQVALFGLASLTKAWRSDIDVIGDLKSSTTDGEANIAKEPCHPG